MKEDNLILQNVFKKLYEDSKVEWRKRRLIIDFFNPLGNLSFQSENLIFDRNNYNNFFLYLSLDIKTRSNHGQKSEATEKTYRCLLSKSEEKKIIGELFNVYT